MLNNVLFMLLGAGLVIIGVITTAYAERIRASRSMETAKSPTTHGQERRPPRPPVITIEPAEMPRTRSPAPRETDAGPPEMPRIPAVTRTARAPRQTTSNSGDDVVAALMAAGYKRTIATEATWACGEAERTTIEHWTASALRRCGRGSLS
jgi:hypothetical protein